MKNKAKQSVSLALALCLASGTVPTALAAKTDIGDHWAKEAVQEFIDKGYVLGDGHGNYKLDEMMSRAQFATILNRTMGYTEESSEIAGYRDVKQDAWYKSELAKALAAGYMNGTTDTTMAPDQTVSREQAFTMIGRALNVDVTSTEQKARFADQDQIAPYAVDYINAMAEKGYVLGNKNGEVMPKKALTRAEGITVLARAEHAKVQGTLKDGVYTGTGAGYGGTIKVEVTVQKGKISDIKVLSHSETLAYYNRAKKLIDSIIKAQSVEGVDTVSGATLTSKGILTAVNACISQAKGGPDTSKTGSMGGGHGHGNATKPGNFDFGFIPAGTYTGEADGYKGKTKVKVTADKDRVIMIEVLSYDDDPTYLKKALAVIDRMLAKQSTNVDAVATATYSSYGIINAVANALNLEGKDTHILQFDPKAPLADGDWYGTATEGFRHGDRGPSIVKVKVVDGKIESVTSQEYNDDTGPYQEKMYRLLSMLKTPDGVAEAAEQIWKRQGTYYDAVTHATYMARGHISAVEHALNRSAQYEKDKVDQKIDWMKMKVRPNHGYFDRPLDLKKTVVEVHFADGTVKDIPFSEMAQHDITADWKDGDIVSRDSDRLESGNNITVKYKHALSGAHTHAQIHLDVYKEIKYPHHLVAVYKDGTTETIALDDKDKFRYEFDPADEITDMVMYGDENKVLMSGKFNPVTRCWVFDMDEVPLGANEQWNWGDYIIHLTKVVDHSPIKSFKAVKGTTNFLVGDLFTLDDLSIDATTENGNIFTYSTPQEWEEHGFEVKLPDGWSEGYELTAADKGSKEITITNKNIEDAKQTIVVTVIEEAMAVPHHISIFDYDFTEVIEDFTAEDIQNLMDGKDIEKTMTLSAEGVSEWKDENGEWIKENGQLAFIPTIDVYDEDWTSFDVELTEKSNTTLYLNFNKEETGLTGRVALTLLFS